MIVLVQEDSAEQDRDRRVHVRDDRGEHRARLGDQREEQQERGGRAHDAEHEDR